MSKLPFQKFHLLKVLEEYESQNLPLDRTVHLYFRAHKALGSKDRAYIAETAYFMMRWKSLLDYCSQQSDWESRLAFVESFDLKQSLENSAIPMHIRASFPKELYERIVDSHPEIGHQLCLDSNEKAPTCIRVNSLKTSRDALLALWKEKYNLSPSLQSPLGIYIHEKMNFFQLPEFKQGLFEVQDEGSQLLADLVQAKPGDHILDYCAGSGGKTLAIAPKMKQKGQLWLHDIRPWALEEAKKRMKRAGVQNAQILLPDDNKQKKLKSKCDIVLVDAPCSGTGTLRRNPDMKWRFSIAMLEQLISLQRVIFEKALSFVKPGSQIVYGTCSLLKEENQSQKEHFLATYPIKQVGEEFITMPTPGGTDGFYGVVFEKHAGST
ncbi:MAG: RsmB/NOP family class I SAM-dependent RNA methyltransferase [Waddliaceae bacterium]